MWRHWVLFGHVEGVREEQIPVLDELGFHLELLVVEQLRPKEAVGIKDVNHDSEDEDDQQDKPRYELPAAELFEQHAELEERKTEYGLQASVVDQLARTLDLAFVKIQQQVAVDNKLNEKVNHTENQHERNVDASYLA